MRNYSKIFFSLLIFAVVFSCKKETNPYFANGSPVLLTSSANTIVPTPADSATNVLTLSWNNPKYATDSAHQKFIIEMDTTANFLHEITFEANGPLSESFTGNQLNTVLANFGFAPGMPFTVHIRVTSSYANNNEAYKSNDITVTMTPYLIPITLTPSSTSSLALSISNATNTAISFNWNASPYGSNVINYALQLDTVGGNFVNPQTIKYGTSLNSNITNTDLNTAIIAAGVPGGSVKNIEFRIVNYLGTTYATALSYSNTVNLEVTTYVAAPANLYIIGDATPEVPAWTNSSLLSPTQQFTKIDAVSFGIIINLTATKSYLFLPVEGDWSHKYGGATDGTTSGGGSLLADNAVPGSNTPAPATSGLYEIIVNFQTNTYTVTPYTGITVPSSIVPNPSTLATGLWIIGDATPEAPSWTNDPVTLGSQQFTQVSNAEYQITIALKNTGSYLLLPAAGDWSNKYGGTSATGGTLLFDNDVPGSNTPPPATAGNYLIDVNFITDTYTLTPQ